MHSINEHFKHRANRIRNPKNMNNYVFTEKYNDLLVFGFIRRFMPWYGYSISDVCSIISKYVSNNSFDFNINVCSDENKRNIASIFVNIDGIDLNTNTQEIKHRKPITFSLKFYNEQNVIAIKHMHMR